MATDTGQLLDTLQSAASTYFTSEKSRLKAESDFLAAIATRRGGATGIQDINAQGASQILAASISDYLGKPLSPT